MAAGPGPVAPLIMRQVFDGDLANLGPEVARALAGRGAGDGGAVGVGFEIVPGARKAARLAAALAAVGSPPRPGPDDLPTVIADGGRPSAAPGRPAFGVGGGRRHCLRPGIRRPRRGFAGPGAGQCVRVRPRPPHRQLAGRTMALVADDRPSRLRPPLGGGGGGRRRRHPGPLPGPGRGPTPAPAPLSGRALSPAWSPGRRRPGRPSSPTGRPPPPGHPRSRRGAASPSAASRRTRREPARPPPGSASS